MRVFKPVPPVRHDQARQQTRLPTLTGKVIGFIDNSKPNFSFLVDDIAELLTRQHGVRSTVKYSKRGPSIPAQPDVIADLCRRCDLIIAGSGD